MTSKIRICYIIYLTFNNKSNLIPFYGLFQRPLALLKLITNLSYTQLFKWGHSTVLTWIVLHNKNLYYMFQKIISAWLQNRHFFVCFLQTGQAKMKERDNNKRRTRFFLQVGSFNYDNTKMVYHTYFLPQLPNSTDPILDYDVSTIIYTAL